MISDFCVFILTHGRAGNVITLKTLEKAGYTGKIYLLIDDEDKMANEYFELYGDRVIQFKKKEIAKTFDVGDNFNDLRSITCARNASFDVASKLGIKYFMELDDDYTFFAYKFDTEYRYKQRNIKSLDKVIESLLKYYKSINALSIAMAQGGDFIGGGEGTFGKEIKLHRKAMNSFICSTDRQFNFVGIMNEDVNTYTSLGSRGNLFFTIPLIVLGQKATQKNKGGISDLYNEKGTYIKAFTTVMFSPSSVKVSMLNSKYKRIHHKVLWDNTVPKILDEKYKKY